MSNYRTARDSFGEVHIPLDKYWGIQTQRNSENFKIGNEQMPMELIHAFAVLKTAAAAANQKLGKLNKEKEEAIRTAAEEILNQQLNDHFPLRVWQTGSGTQSHMNVNEVIANRGNELLKEKGSSTILHPNDDVNMSQSSNDTFPTAMHIASLIEMEDHLLPRLSELKETLQQKAEEYKNIVKIGRTHLQDATPLTLGQEISGWARCLEKNEQMIKQASQYLKELAIGGTAVGTGINAHPDFAEMVVSEINTITKKGFSSSANKFQSLTSHDEIAFTHGALKALAADLMKIANDVRWLASGPRSGIGEIKIKALEQGSSIMPGKVNPTQSEALTMVAVQVMGNDAAIGFAASQGNFELNVFKPVIIYNFLQSIRLLGDGMNSFHLNCAKSIEPNLEVIDRHVKESLMLVTALNPVIGYDKAAEIAKKAYNENKTLKEVAVANGYLSEDEFDKYVDPEKMTKPSE